MKIESGSYGFSLIELMIVVVIIGIITAIAYPSYIDNIRETRRTTAQADLMDLAQWMERQYSTDYSYYEGGKKPVLPYTASPQSGTSYYNLSLLDGDMGKNSYTLQAAPTGDQVNDDCGTLTLNQAGSRGHSSGANCW
ncbi:type IV pilin protein [Marinobacter mangrovi]|uniref:type IV pilin protein n=1 Tax=Marinobacter mangrovi TaxID=2803918 RepID=UPI0019348863|nr:type IV pilin protein [Marinobacter mangrovi]